MMFGKKILLLSMLVGAITGCSTRGTFVVPEGADLYIHHRSEPVVVKEDGTVTTRPYSWSAMGVAPSGGITYRLEQDGEVVKEGKLRAVFRGASIFWPPYAIIYWPTGLNPHITYDLVNDTQE